MQQGIEPIPHESQPCAPYLKLQIVFPSLPKDILYFADWDIRARGVKFLIQPYLAGKWKPGTLVPSQRDVTFWSK